MKLKFIALLILALIIANTLSAGEKEQQIVLVNGTKFTYSLVEKWVSEYNKTNPPTPIEIATKNSAGKNIVLDLVAHQILDSDLPTNQTVLYVGRYALIPISNKYNPLIAKVGKGGLSKKKLKQLFFEDTDEFGDEVEESKSKYMATVYSRENQASTTITLARYFGVTPLEIKGKKIFGDDLFLLNAIKNDSTGITFNSLGYVYDLQNRKLRNDISLLPLNLKLQQKEAFSSLDNAIAVPDKLPAIEQLKKENIFVMTNARAARQDIRPLRIALLNLMPLKIVTETDIVRVLSNTPLQLELDFIGLQSHECKNTPIEHIREFYTDFSDIKQQKFDGLIITGAPVEQIEFEEVDYWQEITEIFDWARTHVTSTLFICWSAQAALYHYYGIPKYPLDHKMFGAFPHTLTEPLNPLFRGFDDLFFAPHSRHTEIRRGDIEKVAAITILAESEEAGIFALSARKGREIFVTGHAEYAPETLHNEYVRDKARNLPIEIPKNYYENDDPAKHPVVQWRAHANLLFSNWLNYFVYQVTPYYIDSIH